MEFRNLTPFPAIAFDGIDQHHQRFHSVVMRLTFALQDDGALSLAPVQTPLAMTDEFYSEANRSSVRQESDLAPYKPHTDVIVIADACAPQGKPSNLFGVALKINGAPTTPELPPEPHGVNPTYHASPERMAEWREQCARLTAKALEGPVVLRKVLLIRGAREWRRRHPVTRALSLFTLPPWKLTAPLPLTTLPLRYEYAYGGENKILATEQAASRVDKKYRLPGRVPQSGNPGAGDLQEAIAHSVYEQNPVGRGFANYWYLHAAKLACVPAPHIEVPSQPIGHLGKKYLPQGFGVVGRSWRPRLGLAGTYDQQWLDERHPDLPADFDFGYWNGAPADQQVTPHMRGDEQISLVNLCPENAATQRDASGNTCLSFSLPGHLPFVLVRFQDGRIGELAAKLDTLIIDAAADAGDPEKRIAVVCVWRATLATAPGVRVLEARMLTHDDVARRNPCLLLPARTVSSWPSACSPTCARRRWDRTWCRFPTPSLRT
jgi:hypothetical protein